MSSVDVINKTEAAPEAEPVDMKLEVVMIAVSDVDRAKAFYENVPTTLREPRLLGQPVVVIGGNSGIGLAMACRARAEGVSFNRRT